MELLVITLVLGIAIAIGIALAPYIIPLGAWALGIAIATLVIAAVVRLLFSVLRVGAQAIPLAASGAWLWTRNQAELVNTGCQMLISPRLPNETSTLKRRFYGLIILALFTGWAALLSLFLLSALSPRASG